MKGCEDLLNIVVLMLQDVLNHEAESVSAVLSHNSVNPPHKAVLH